MKHSKLSLAIAVALTAGASSSAFAINLYVDTKTQQIYAQPGKNRVLMGEFEKVGDKSAATAVAPSSEMAAVKQDLEYKTNEIKALQEHAEEAAKHPMVELNDNGFELRSKDGNFTAAVNGRLQVDSQVNVNQNVLTNAFSGTATTVPQNRLANGVGLRRGRLGVEGKFFKDWDYKFEYDFTRGNGTTGAGVTDAYIRWNLDKAFSVKVGSFKEPFSLEEATSNRYITFIERSMAVNTFIDNLNTYRLGIGANYAADRWQVATAFQTEPVGANGAWNTSTNTNGGGNRNGSSGDTTWGANMRVSGMPWMESKTKFWHIGASGSYARINNNYTAAGVFNNGGMSFTVNPDTNVDRTAMLNTGNLTSGNLGAVGSRQASNLTRFGAETAVVYGPFSAQAEYIRTSIAGKGYNGTEVMDGYYAYGSYFLTGESRNYKSKTGAWDRLKPTQNFDGKGGWGAWELAAGYDYINLNANLIQGGRLSTAKVALNWYPNSHIRVMANYIHALDISNQLNPAALTGNQSKAWDNTALDIIETRVQLDF